MAMRKCRECKEPVSTDAKTCPRCGKPNPTGGSITCSGAVLGVMLFAVVAYFVFRPARPPASPQPNLPDTPLNPAQDEGADVIAKCGKPQADIVKVEGGQRMRHITYKAANVELLYLLGATKPSQLVGVFPANNDKMADALSSEEANARLKCANGSLRLPAGL